LAPEADRAFPGSRNIRHSRNIPSIACCPCCGCGGFPRKRREGSVSKPLHRRSDENLSAFYCRSCSSDIVRRHTTRARAWNCFSGSLQL